MIATTADRNIRRPMAFDIMLGMVVWCLLALSSFTPTGPQSATLFFLLGPLIAVPLALELATHLTPTTDRSRLLGLARQAQPIAAWAAAASFMTNAPWIAGTLALVWTALTLIVAGDGVRRASRLKMDALDDLCLLAASLYLGASGVMFALARFGFAPLNTQVIDVLGASIHLQFAGFCTLVIAAAGERARLPSAGVHERESAIGVAAVVVGPITLVTGFVLGWRPLEWLALLCIAVGIAYIVGRQLAHSRTAAAPGGVLLGLSSLAALAGIAIAIVAAMFRLLDLGSLDGSGILTLDQMIVLHGTTMGVGFVLASLAGWRLAIRTDVAEVIAQTTGPDEFTPPKTIPAQCYDDLQTGRTLAIMIMATAAASLVYRLLLHGRLEQTAALFIGIPSILGILLALTPPARTSSGMMFKGITLALLASGALLGEGFICIVMAAPLFYAVGLLVMFIDRYCHRRSRALLALVPLLPLSLEGVTDEWSFPRAERVVVERLVVASPDAVEQALARTPNFERALPFALNIGFPRPRSTAGSGLQVGDRRTIGFGGGEGKPGDLVLEVAERSDDRVLFRAVTDTSHIAHWLNWRDAEFVWSTHGDATQVRLTLRFDRRLDPAWYFRPMERLIVGHTGSYLIDTIATP